jgi:hypothetical protein
MISLRRHAPVDDPEDSDPVLVLDILHHLDSLLSNVTSSDQIRPIVPLHTSFRDFLTNKTSDVFYVNLGDAHHQLAHSYLGLMLDDLKFNICKLESSYLANSNVSDLDSRITEHIPPALPYACVLWGGTCYFRARPLRETCIALRDEVPVLVGTVQPDKWCAPCISSIVIWLPQDMKSQ